MSRIFVLKTVVEEDVMVAVVKSSQIRTKTQGNK